MVLAVLDREYSLQTCMTNKTYATVFMATHGDGQKCVVKFIWEPDAFFEELARHFALDDLDFVCQLKNNYPPYCVSRNPFAFDPRLAALLDVQQVPDLAEPEACLASTLASVGALVIEYVEGVPLLEELGQLSQIEQIQYLNELARLMGILHEAGECHGNLVAPNVIVESGSDHIVLLDLGFSPLKTLPSGQFRTPEVLDEDRVPNAADDVYMFARNFLMALPDPNLKLQELIGTCLDPVPEIRPSFVQIQRHLEKQIADLVKTPNSLWPRIVMMSCVTALILTWSFLGGWSNPSNQPSDSKLATKNMLVGSNPTQNGLLAEAWGLPLDLEKPLAVFNHPHNALIIGRDNTYKIGDQLSLKRGNAVIRAIDEQKLTLQTDSGDQEFLFPETGFHPARGENSLGWMVWNQPGNLPRLLNATSTMLLGWESDQPLSGETDLGYVLQRYRMQLRISEDTIYGFYPAMGARHFLDLLSTQLDLKPKGQSWEISRRSDLPPLYFSFHSYLIEEVTVQGFCDHLKQRTGLQIDCDKELGDRELPRRLFSDVQWQDMLHSLGFKWTLHELPEGPRIAIK